MFNNLIVSNFSIVVFLKYINIKLTLRLPCRDISNVLYFKSNCNVHHITRVVLRLGTWDWIVQIFLWKRALSDKLLFCLISSSFQMHLFTFWSSTNVSFVRMNVNRDEDLMRPEKLIDIWDPTNTVADYEHWKKVNIKETIDVIPATMRQETRARRT